MSLNITLLSFPHFLGAYSSLWHCCVFCLGMTASFKFSIISCQWLSLEQEYEQFYFLIIE